MIHVVLETSMFTCKYLNINSDFEASVIRDMCYTQVIKHPYIRQPYLLRCPEARIFQ